MRIAVISSQVFAITGNQGLPGYGGLEVIAFHQAKGLAERGHKVALIAPEGSSCPGVTVIPSGPPGQWDERKAFSTYWQKLLACDAVIDNSWSKWAYTLKIDGQLKAPVLGVMHAPVNTMYQSLPAVDKPCFVCISKDQAAHFEALFSRPARCAYNGVDVDFYRPMDLKRTGRFLFLARFSTIKGADLAIEACRKAGVGLDLVGDTSITNEPDFFRKCADLCDGKQIRLVGPATRGECVWWFSKALALLHPNQRFREPFGLAPVEAMACGCPVIAWDNGAMRETVSNGISGWLVKSQEELNGLVSSSAANSVLDAMRNSSREWAKQFSVEKMCARYEELCQEAIAGGW